MSMKIVSWNTNGLRATIKQGYFDPLFSTTKADIVCFQEVKAEPGQISEEYRNYKKYHSYFSYSKVKKGYSGVAIYTIIEPKKVEYGIGIPRFDDEGRTIIAFYDDFVLINCYFPNGGGGPERLQYKLEFYDAFLEYVDALKKSGHEIIFCGDINTAHEAIDLARPKENEENTGFLPIERAWLDEVILHGYYDVFRSRFPTQKDSYTYWDQKTRARDRNVGWRIDYFFVTPKMYTKIVDIQHLTEVMGSDHCPVVLTLS